MAGEPPVLHSVGYLLLKAGHHVQTVVDRVLAADGLTGREFLVLSFVSGDGPLSQQDLSRRLGLDPTLIVGLIDGLEGRSLLTRSRDPADRRRYVLSLTAGGRTLLGRATATVGDAEAEFLEPITPTDRTRLRELLDDVMRDHLS